MDKNYKFDKFYMEFAIKTANFSYCKRKQVGAVLVKDDIIVVGYNGTIKGEPNECEDCKGDTKPEVLHAETNALSKIMQSSISSKGATMYCTFSACLPCSKLLIQAGISRFVYLDTHSDQTGLELMKKQGIIVDKFKFDGE